jgi:putative N6-adenine-specific DNA methylase
MKTGTLRCYAVAAPGIEGLVASELGAIGIDGRADTGGVAWTGDAASLYRANLWLRTATRVLVRVARFRATTFWELERRAAATPWAALVKPGMTVAFRVTAKKSKLYHSGAIGQRLAESVMKAVPGVRVVDAPGEEPEQEPAGEDGAGDSQLFVARLAHDELTLSIDSSGAPLYRRGYRQAVAKAPLRETLAAALLMSSGWEPGDPLVDPFCGSGVIPIEAALMAARIAPGLAAADRTPRAFAFTGWPQFDLSLWRKCVDDAAAVASSDGMPPVVGFDRDEGAIVAARANAERAGLTGKVGFDAASISVLRVPEGAPGWIVTNPPYGIRVGEQGEVRRLYAAFGRAVRERAPGWHLAMLSPDPRLDAIAGTEAGRRLEERLRTRNGGIPVRVVAR